MDSRETTSWRSAPTSAKSQTLDIDFLKRREFGGMIVDWEPDARASAYTVSGSTNETDWQTLYTVEHGGGARDYLYLPESDARYVRLTFPSRTSPIGIREIKIEPLAWSASKNDFFSAIARDASPGSYPKSVSYTHLTLPTICSV